MADERDEEKSGKAEDRQRRQQQPVGQDSAESEYGEIGEVDQPGSFAGGTRGRQAEIQGEGFIAGPNTDTDDYLQEAEDQHFAREGQGAIETPPPTAASDVERERDRREAKDSDIEGGVG
jgi:hypothetical protein